MSDDAVERLLAEAAHLPPVPDRRLDALRRAILVEDLLGVVLTEEQILGADLTNPAVLRELAAVSRSG